MEARLIMMGNAVLAQGFALIGFETWPDADIAQLEQRLAELLRQNEPALIFLEPHLAKADSSLLKQVQHQGSRIMITEIPPLSQPEAYCPEVESLLAEVFGASIMD